DFDMVSFQNGNLHIEIPIVSLPQRGRTFAWRYVYDTPSWDVIRYFEPDIQRYTNWFVTGPEDNTQWRLTDPFAWEVSYDYTQESCPCPNPPSNSCSYGLRANWFVQDPDGTKHPFALRQESGYVCLGSRPKSSALDWSGISVDATQFPTVTVTLKDG